MLTDAEFAFVAREVKARSGALLTRDMNGPAEQRLAPLARREGFGSVSEFLTSARHKQDEKAWAAIADALVQTETRFFRDKKMFERLRKEIIPEIAHRRGSLARLRIWSAGTGGGQEAYSLAMMAEEIRNEGGPAIDIVATDFSERLLDKARSGLYTQFEVQRGLPIRKLIAHFEKVGDLWRISDRLRASVRFEQHNLMQHASNLTGSSGPFDIVLCCNVFTHFDAPTRDATLSRIADATAADGVLFIGEGENLPEGLDNFAHAGGIYTRVGARRAA